MVATAGECSVRDTKGSSLSQGPAPRLPSVLMFGALVEDTSCSDRDRQRP